jgi:hypothetical protein
VRPGVVRLDCHWLRSYFRYPPGNEEHFNCSLCTRDDFCFNNSLYNCSDALMQSEPPGSGFFENCTCVNRYYNNGTRCEDCGVDFACVCGLQHACPALEWTNGLTRQEACVCRPGVVRAGAECVPCSDDFFCDGRDNQQHPCPPSSLGRGATNVSECLCNVTFEVVHINNVSEPHACRGCPLDYFKHCRQHALPAMHALPARLRQRLDAHCVRRRVRRHVRRVHRLPRPGRGGHARGAVGRRGLPGVRAKMRIARKSILFEQKT